MAEGREIRPGACLGNYQVEAEIGRRAFAAIYRARHRYLPDRQVALKIPLNPAYVAELRRAGAIQGRVYHTGVVQVLDLDLEAVPPYLVLEWVDGETLREHIRRLSPLLACEVYSLLKQILTALHAAHERGIVHRDLKPENVMIARYGGVKITDFGLAAIEDQLRQSLLLSVSSEEAQRIVGTFEYMPPEQREGRGVDGRADLYAVGVMLFEMLTGRRPTIHDRIAERKTAFDDLFRRLCCPVEQRIGSAQEALDLSSAHFAGAAGAQSAVWMWYRDGRTQEEGIWIEDCGLEDFRQLQEFVLSWFDLLFCHEDLCGMEGELFELLEYCGTAVPDRDPDEDDCGASARDAHQRLEQLLEEHATDIRQGKTRQILGRWSDLLDACMDLLVDTNTELRVWTTCDACDLAAEMLEWEQRRGNVLSDLTP